MRVSYRAVDDLDGVLAWQKQGGARSLVFDVEPLVAVWDTGQDALRAGVDRLLDHLTGAPGLEVVVFATNSLRDLPVQDRAGLRVSYLTAARKPFATTRYAGLPGPGIVVGDQVATDGVLAWRLGMGFAHLQYTHYTPPRGPRLMRQLGRPLKTRLFTTTDGRP